MRQYCGFLLQDLVRHIIALLAARYSQPSVKSQVRQYLDGAGSGLLARLKLQACYCIPSVDLLLAINISIKQGVGGAE
jgi:hypothetical protein